LGVNDTPVTETDGFGGAAAADAGPLPIDPTTNARAAAPPVTTIQNLVLMLPSPAAPKGCPRARSPGRPDARPLDRRALPPGNAPATNWNASDSKPLNFSFGAQNATPNQLKKWSSKIRVDRFVSASAKSLRRLDTVPDVLLFAAERPDGNIEAIQQPAAGADSFRFTSLKKGDDHYMLELQVANIGASLPAQALAYPDLPALRRDIAVTDLDDQLLPAFIVLLRDGRAWMAKFGLAAGPELQKKGDQLLNNPDWDDLRRRDKDLGPRYRAALAKQGIVLRPLNAPASTQSAH